MLANNNLKICHRENALGIVLIGYSQLNTANPHHLIRELTQSADSQSKKFTAGFFGGFNYRTVCIYFSSGQLSRKCLRTFSKVLTHFVHYLHPGFQWVRPQEEWLAWQLVPWR